MTGRSPRWAVATLAAVAVCIACSSLDLVAASSDSSESGNLRSASLETLDLGDPPTGTPVQRETPLPSARCMACLTGEWEEGGHLQTAFNNVENIKQEANRSLPEDVYRRFQSDIAEYAVLATQPKDLSEKYCTDIGGNTLLEGLCVKAFRAAATQGAIGEVLDKMKEFRALLLEESKREEVVRKEERKKKDVADDDALVAAMADLDAAKAKVDAAKAKVDAAKAKVDAAKAELSPFFKEIISRTLNPKLTGSEAKAKTAPLRVEWCKHTRQCVSEDLFARPIDACQDYRYKHPFETCQACYVVADQHRIAGQPMDFTKCHGRDESAVCGEVVKDVTLIFDDLGNASAPVSLSEERKQERKKEQEAVCMSRCCSPLTTIKTIQINPEGFKLPKRMYEGRSEKEMTKRCDNCRRAAFMVRRLMVTETEDPSLIFPKLHRESADYEMYNAIQALLDEYSHEQRKILIIRRIDHICNVLSRGKCFKEEMANEFDNLRLYKTDIDKDSICDQPPGALTPTEDKEELNEVCGAGVLQTHEQTQSTLKSLKDTRFPSFKLPQEKRGMAATVNCKDSQSRVCKAMASILLGTLDEYTPEFQQQASQEAATKICMAQTQSLKSGSKYQLIRVFFQYFLEKTQKVQEKFNQIREKVDRGHTGIGGLLTSLFKSKDQWKRHEALWKSMELEKRRTPEMKHFDDERISTQLKALATAPDIAMRAISDFSDDHICELSYSEEKCMHATWWAAKLGTKEHLLNDMQTYFRVKELILERKRMAKQEKEGEGNWDEEERQIWEQGWFERQRGFNAAFVVNVCGGDAQRDTFTEMAAQWELKVPDSNRHLQQETGSEEASSSEIR